MHVIVYPGSVYGSAQAPSSKSHAQRVLAAALLHAGTTFIHQLGNAEDENAVCTLIQTAGAKLIRHADNFVEVQGRGKELLTGYWFCGESGLASRLFAWLAAAQHEEVVLEGTGSLLKRPMKGFRETAQQLGVQVVDRNGCLPCAIKGPFHPKDITIDASYSSQFLTGMLYAYAWYADQKMVITADRLPSKPYINLTVQVLQAFGKNIMVDDDYRHFILLPQEDVRKDYHITIEGDWSNSAVLLVAGAMKGTVTVKGLQFSSVQADKAILTVLEQCGVNYTIDQDTITVSSSMSLKPFEWNAQDCPDLFPILAILASVCSGVSRLYGLHRLIYKESNRKDAIIALLTAFGVDYKVEGDCLTVKGSTKPLRACKLTSWEDHRMVMAATIGALMADGPVEILHADAIQKSWPEFFQTMQQLRVSLELY